MTIIKEVENYTLQYFKENITELLSYHSVEHTKLVVSYASIIADAEGLDTRNKEIVLVAAWLHDIGYAVSMEKHEEESCKIARRFLSDKDLDEEFISEVEACILSTKIGVPKISLNQKILSDADIAHTGVPYFIEISNLLRKELSNFEEKKSTKLEYWQNTLEFLTKTKFRTPYAIENMEKEKNENIAKVERRIEELKSNVNENSKSTGRGVETMFRLTARNQINLSSIADNKANMMLTINAVIVSVLVSTSAFTFTADNGFNLLVPGLILIVGSLISLVFAVLSVRPKIVSSDVSDEQLRNRELNLLFFGNFHKMDYSKYESAMKEMMQDYDYLYGSLIRDQFNLGKVLSVKYKLLTYSYNFFMFSFVIAVITFFVMYFIEM